MRFHPFPGVAMTRTRNNTTQASAATLVSAGMLLATG